MAKKYQKGVTTPKSVESANKGSEFMQWFAASVKHITRCVQKGGTGTPVNEDILHDTAIRVYEAIAFKGTEVSDFLGYFLTSYRMATYAAASSRYEFEELTPEHGRTAEVYDAEAYECAVFEFTEEVLEYVRGAYKPYAVSLFEMYVGLSPQVSTEKLANMLNLSPFSVRNNINEIKADVRKRFGSRVRFLQASNF